MTTYIVIEKIYIESDYRLSYRNLVAIAGGVIYFWVGFPPNGFQIIRNGLKWGCYLSHGYGGPRTNTLSFWHNVTDSFNRYVMIDNFDDSSVVMEL